MDARICVSRASSSFRRDARAIFSAKAACSGSWEAAIDGCAVEDECARAARSSGFASMSARSFFLVTLSVSIQGRDLRRYRRFILQYLGKPLLARIGDRLCIIGWSRRRPSAGYFLLL